ncbi:hypothetical protein SGLAM104S_06457 [Streptomyces glaucescens]
MSPARSAGKPIRTSRPVQVPQYRQPGVAQPYVHHDQPVHRHGVGDPAQALLALVLGEDQHVVAVRPGGGHHRRGEPQRRRGMHARPQRHHQRQHVRPAGQAARRAGGSRGCGWRPGRGAGLLGDRAFAAEHVRDGARGDARVPRHVRDLDHQCPVSPRWSAVSVVEALRQPSTGEGMCDPGGRQWVGRESVERFDGSNGQNGTERGQGDEQGRPAAATGTPNPAVADRCSAVQPPAHCRRRSRPAVRSPRASCPR